MVANYNDLLRKKISDYFNNSEDTDGILDFFYNLDDVGQETVIRLALSDIYKLNYYMDGEAPNLFKIPVDQLVDKCIVDVGLVVDVLSGSKMFNDMDYVSKTLLLETMEDNDQDKNIENIYKFHVLDKITYRIIDDIECYKEYYKEYLEVNKDKTDRIFTITNYITYRMIDLKYEDEIKYKKYILEFIKVYYKWKYFIKNHEGKYLLNKNDVIYLDIIESKSIEEIFIYVEDNSDFLINIVGEYLYYKTQKVEIKEDVIDNYFNTSSSEDLKQKLKIK